MVYADFKSCLIDKLFQFFLLQGDSIEYAMGTFMVISTMAAAALGNTLSDVLGIGLSSYVERGVSKLGFSGPNLSPIQLDMKTSRVFANFVRTFFFVVFFKQF